MKKQLSSLMILSLCGILTACPGPKGFRVQGSPYSLLNGREAKKTYETITTVGIADLNYLKTSAAQNAQHFANFIDGLLTHNDFGTLELNLAESARANSSYTEFTFKVRSDENLYWSTFEGQPYKFNGEIQYVKASDFVAGSKIVNSFSTQSDTGYLQRDFIKGAVEYYHYTEIQYKAANGVDKYVKIAAKPAKIVEYLNETIQENYPHVWEAQYDEATGGSPITVDDIPNIANGSRLGVVANDATNEVTYKLLQSARYFPTLLTYSAYLPVNQHFYDEKKASFGKASCDAILYCGPYILSTLDDHNIIYSRNEAYMNRADVKANSYKAARIETVHYKIETQEIDSSYVRNAFERGEIDGFSLSQNDSEGWTKYVVGEDGSGTLQEPVSGLVNSRWLDTIGECYGTNIVMNRSSESSSLKTYCEGSTTASVKNTEKALMLEEVRKMILEAIDYRTYYSRYSGGIEDDIFAVQKLVSTYVPLNFVYDDNGNEYTQEYYAQALADLKGISKAEAQALIAVGQYETRQLDMDDTKDGTSERAKIAELVDNAVEAINKFNANSTLTTKYGGPITFPVNLEYYSAWNTDQETKAYDTAFINVMNERFNYDVEENQTKHFVVIPTDGVTTANRETVSGSTNGAYAAYDFAVVQWGWGADYGDPLTYMNTYTIGGDWSSVFGFVGQENVDTIKFNGNTPVTSNLLEEYTEIVNEGKKQNDNLTSRFGYFAQAEVKLIEELQIYKPQVNYGQGWSLSISNSAGYEMPTANYGLSNDRMTGMWVLKQPLTREERKQIREEQEAAKKAWCDSHDSYNIYG